MTNDIQQSTGPAYVEVVLPVAVGVTFTYAVPSELRGRVGVGHRVIVPLGQKKFYTGIVVGLPPKAPADVEVKEVAMALDDAPILRHPQLKLWEWIADYYLCTLGDVYRAALPAGLKIESETFLELNPDYDLAEQPPLTEREALVWQLLDHEGQLSAAEIGKRLKVSVAPTLHRMVDAGALIVAEKLVERYTVKTITMVRPEFTAANLADAFAAVKGAKKQETLLLALIEMSGLRSGQPTDVVRDALAERAGVSNAIIKAVADKGLVSITKKAVSRFRYEGGKPLADLPHLTPPQLATLDTIVDQWRDHDVTLLRGVTSSGKTEIYIHLIDAMMRRGLQALYLVPEIALTTQLTSRLQAVFGEKVVVYHSKFSDNERVDIWRKLLNSSEPLVVVGPRSAVFLPFAKLGVVIVDEEHESSYKQYDPAPRYNGRDTAMVLARMHGAKTLLGSATPSVETYFKAREGKFGLAELSTRYADVALPSIKVIDMTAARKAKKADGILSHEMVSAVRSALAGGRQAILFHNRRGFAPLARCKQCAWTPRCEKCDVALTYHRRLDRLMCHYCGATYPLPSLCPQCKEPAIEILGFGTERVEDDVEAAFPDARVLRMDLDTTRNKEGHSNLIDQFSQRKADILVGTQMVTKGLDFGGVSFVGVLNADSVINYPDFRSAERAFNMLEQVAGRAGRRGDGPQGEVMVQTAQPSHPIIGHVLAHDYLSFYETELEERRRFAYPPFSRVIYIYLKHRDPATLRSNADIYARELRELLGNRVFGPEEPLVGRIQSLYIRKIMLKIETNASVAAVKRTLRSVYEKMYSLPSMKGTIVYYDVDPQ